MVKKKSWKDKSGLRDEMKIRKLLLETKNHDRDTCRCEGCYMWAMGRTLVRGGRFFTVIPSWKNLERDEYLRIIQSTIRYKMDKKMSKKKIIKYLMSKKESRGLTKKQLEEIADKMLEGIHMVMYGDAPSALGILRDI